MLNPPEDKRFFYGWYIVAVTFFCRFMATGVGFYIFNAFMKPLVEERGWTREQINLAPVLGGIVGLFGMLFYGTMVLRVGPRLLMTIGPIISGVAFACLGMVEQIWQFYLLNILLYFGNGAMAGIVANTAVNNWFVQKRGKAIGLSSTGISFSGAILPFIAMILLDSTDLSGAFLRIGLVIMVMSPVSWFLIKDNPEKHGLYPDGMPPEKDVEFTGEIPLVEDPLTGGAGANAKSNIWTFSMVTRSPTFWKLGTVYALTMMGVVGVMFQLAPRFEDLGFDKKTAMIMMSLTALIGALGKYVWGALCDKFDPRKIVALLVTGTGLGLALGLLQNSYPALLLFIVVLGFAMGGVVSTAPIMIGFLFGREAYASVARFLGLIVRLNLIGYFIMGQSFKYTGSYDTAYMLFIVFNLIAAAIVFSIKRKVGTVTPF